MSDLVDKPEIVDGNHLDYLDTLRESGICNMFGASPYLEDAYDLSKRDARVVLQYWMNSFGERTNES